MADVGAAGRVGAPEDALARCNAKVLDKHNRISVRRNDREGAIVVLVERERAYSRRYMPGDGLKNQAVNAGRVGFPSKTARETMHSAGQRIAGIGCSGHTRHAPIGVVDARTGRTRSITHSVLS